MEIMSSKTGFTAIVMLENMIGTALIDSANAITFITPIVAQQAKCALTPTKRRKVMVAKMEEHYGRIHCPIVPSWSESATRAEVPADRHSISEDGIVGAQECTPWSEPSYWCKPTLDWTE